MSKVFAKQEAADIPTSPSDISIARSAIEAAMRDIAEMRIVMRAQLEIFNDEVVEFREQVTLAKLTMQNYADNRALDAPHGPTPANSLSAGLAGQPARY